MHGSGRGCSGNSAQVNGYGQIWSTHADTILIIKHFYPPDNFETASLPTTTPEERKRLLSFVVCGGGPTGVETAAVGVFTADITTSTRC